MRAALATCLAAALLVWTAMALPPGEYSCPDSCNQSKACHCASTNIPGGLDPKDTPLFIVLTNDDAINPTTLPAILNITERHKNANGCKMPATWFVSTNFSDPGMVQQVYVKGHEIATHTIHHVANPGVDEIVGSKMWLNQSAKIPLEKLQGFRAPFLLFSPEQREILYHNGFRYDSTISESYGEKRTTSPDAQHLLWPYTMDYGIAQDCAVTTGTCRDDERYPGLWEFPMWNVQDADGNAVASMDPQGNNYDLYKMAFDERYFGGNHAPLGIFIHAGWMIAEPDHLAEINQFLDYAMSHEGVFLVTISQVLDWIQNPVPASRYSPPCVPEAEMLTQLPGGALCVAPQGGCLYGTFNASTCVCDCQNERVNAGGYCKDKDGRCTVDKSFDFTATAYTCPKGSASSGPAPDVRIPVGSGAVALDLAQCGHPLLPYQGLAMSGGGDSSDVYAQAMKAIDGSCNTCAQAAAAGADGAFFAIILNGEMALSGVSLLSSSDQAGIEIRVGSDASNNGLGNPACAKGVAVAGGSTPTVVPCAASGSVVTIVSTAGMTLCDVYPVAAGGADGADDTAGAASAAAASVLVELDIGGVRVADFSSADSAQEAALCDAIVKMTGDTSATCAVIRVVASAAATPNRRRSLLEAGVHVTLRVNTTSPATLLAACASGSSVASALQPAGLQVNPATVEAYAVAAPAPGTPAPGAGAGPAHSGGGGVPVAAIAGAAGGAAAVLALIVALVAVKRRRAARRAAAAAAGDGSADAPPSVKVVGASATLTVGANAAEAKVKLVAASEAERDAAAQGSPIASFSSPRQQQLE